MNFWTRALSFPPCLCRLLARNAKGKPMTGDEIVRGSGPGALSPYEVEALSQSTSWKGVDMAKMAAYLKGCDMDFCNTKRMRQVDDYLRKEPTFQYLRVSKDWKAYYKPLLLRWALTLDLKEDLHPSVCDLAIRLLSAAHEH